MKKRGFTLIEMLIVIIIIGILAATLIPRIGNARDRANDVARVADVKSIATALTSYGLDHSSYSAITGLYEDDCPLLGADYGLGGIMPTDPAKTQYDFNTLGDSKDHFVVCATLSDATSNNGNASENIATNGTDSYTGGLAGLDGAGQYYCYVG